MSIHDAFLELAATALDFDLDETERAELDRHIAGCDACRRTAAAFREDAAAIAYGAGPRLSQSRSEAILSAALRPPKGGPPIRLLAVAALIAVLGAGLVAAGMEYLRRANNPIVAVVPSPSASSAPGPSNGLSASPSSPGGSTQPPEGTPIAGVSPAPAALPVRGSGGAVGDQIRMAPGADGGLYVSIPAEGGDVVVLLDEAGDPRPGWPILLVDVDACDLLLPVADGSVRVVCAANPSGDNPNGTVRRLFAFDRNGRSMAGWPVDIDHAFTWRMVGDDLTLLVGGFFDEGGEAGDVKPVSMVAIDANGNGRKGADVPFSCCDSTLAIGPDGVAYGSTHRDWSSVTSVKTDVVAFGLEGPRAGWPVTVDGNASEPAFAADGRLYVVVGAPHEVPARTVVFDQDGHELASGSDALVIPSTGTWSGAGNDFPGPAIVADDGTAYIVSTEGPGSNTTVVGIDPNGTVMPGWPYRSSKYVHWTGTCAQGDTGCGQTRTAPAVGPDNVLYLLMEPSGSKAGGSVIAIGPDGQVRDGWPVGLTRPGAEFLSVVAAPTGTAYALAIEPEPNGGYSATVLSLAPNSKVDYTRTLLEP